MYTGKYEQNLKEQSSNKLLYFFGLARQMKARRGAAADKKYFKSSLDFLINMHVRHG
jgi:hypothetical protein